MACLSGLLPAPQGVAVYAALTRHADTLRGTGDARSRGQIMADTLVERVTGQTTATAVPVEIHLVMTDTTLLGTRTRTRTRTASPARHRPDGSRRGDAVDPGTLSTRRALGDAVDVAVQLEGYGPLPAPWVRDWLRDTDAPRCGCAASTPTPTPGSWSRPTPDAAGSPDSSAGS